MEKCLASFHKIIFINVILLLNLRNDLNRARSSVLDSARMIFSKVTLRCLFNLVIILLKCGYSFLVMVISVSKLVEYQRVGHLAFSIYLDILVLWVLIHLIRLSHKR